MTNRQVQALRWAVGKAEEWRGSLTGNPDPLSLEEFDAEIQLAKTALAEVGRMRGAERMGWAAKTRGGK